MTREDDLISWKTKAWTDPAMVAWYARRMEENAGTNRLNNLLETGYIRSHTVGRNVLDIGIGTGRASLPLARDGLAVTGIDSSAAMLAETRRQAGDVPITLQVGDVLDLPVPDDTFDTAMALNVLTHFPHWREVIAHWSRKVRPGGRLLFDVYSLDHVNAATGSRLTDRDLVPGDAGQFGTYNLRIRVADLVERADELGLAVRAIVPYRALFDGSDVNRWLLAHLDQAGFGAALAALASDDTLLELALFLEREFAGRLSSSVTGKFMVVIDRIADPAGNRQLLERQSAIDAALATPFSPETLAPWLALSPAEWRAELAARLVQCNAEAYLRPLLKAWQALSPDKRPALELFFPASWLARPLRELDSPTPAIDTPALPLAPAPLDDPRPWHLHRRSAYTAEGTLRKAQGTPLLADYLFGRAILRVARGRRALWVGPPQAVTIGALQQQGFAIDVTTATLADAEAAQSLLTDVPGCTIRQWLPAQAPAASFDLIVLALAGGPTVTSNWQDWWPALIDNGLLCTTYAPSEHPRRIPACSAVSLAALTGWSTSFGARIVALTPFGLLNGAEWSNHWLSELESRFWWQRLLSWLGEERGMLQCAMFIEEGIVAHLPSGTSARNFLVLEKSATPHGDTANRHRNIESWHDWLDGRRNTPPWPADFNADALSRQWLDALQSPRAQVMSYQLLRALSQAAPSAPWQGLLPPDIVQLFADWELQDHLDELSTDFCRRWSRQAYHGDLLGHAGVPLPATLAYPLTEALLTRHYGVFSGSRS